jgi:hypothetical protein
MKHLRLLFILLIILQVVHAQPPRRDTVGWAGAKRTLINAPILLPGAEAMTLVPNRQRFCFDMMVDVELTYGGRTVEQGTFLNNTDGYLGFTTGTTDGSGPRNIIMPEIADFNFMVFGFKGNAYRYFNRKNKQNVIEHWVSTANTDQHKYQISDALTTAPLARKNILHPFLGGTVQAMAYKIDGQPTTWYLHGDHYPEFLHVLKFFGGFGIGTLRAREGTFIVMQMQTGSNSSTIKSIDYNRVCFDATGYKMQEDEFIAGRRLALDKERIRIDRHMESAQRATTCQSQRIAIVNFEREELRRQELNLDNATHGNTYQDATTQNAYLGMMDPLTTVQISILQTRLSICQAQESLNHGGGNAAQTKLSCNTSALASLLNIEAQMRALDIEYATPVGASLSRKAQLWLREMPRPCN